MKYLFLLLSLLCVPAPAQDRQTIGDRLESIRTRLIELRREHAKEVGELILEIRLIQEQLGPPVGVDPDPDRDPEPPTRPPVVDPEPPVTAPDPEWDQLPDYPIKSSWAGNRVEVRAPGRLEGATVSKISAKGPWGTARFRNLTVLNEDQSMFAVGVSDNQPADIRPDETWASSDRATPYGGWLIFEDCHFGAPEGATSWQGFGGKMWLHPQAPASLHMRSCTFDPVREHGVYTEWFRDVIIEDCVFGDTGGNAIQSASRGGHGELGNYLHGNPLNQPAGLGGSALIRNVVIEETYHGFRDASDVTFAGFLGPIVIDGLRCENTISAIAIHTDEFKGAWLANGEDVPWTSPILYRSKVDPEPPAGLYSCPRVDIRGLRVTWDAQHGKRGMVLLSGIKEVNIYDFEIDGLMPAIVINNEYGGRFPCGNVYFHDRASVDAHAGRIGWWDPNGGPSKDGGFRAFTPQQLEDGVIEPAELR